MSATEIVGFAYGVINDRHAMWLPDDRVEFHAARPTWEKDRIDHMSDRVEGGMVVYDIGAECGDFTTLYRTWVGDAGHVIPVEPSMPYWPSIRRTFEANGFDPPAWTFGGFASSVTDLEPRGGGDSSGLRQGWPEASVGMIQPDFGFRHLAQQTVDNQQITIDDLARMTGLAPDVLVLDIEGAEHDAMVGARGVLTSKAVLVYISVHPPTMLDWYGRTEQDLHDLMASYGYAGVYLGTHGGEDFVVFERGEGEPWFTRMT